MGSTARKRFLDRLVASAFRSLRDTGRRLWHLAVVMAPISLGTTILAWSGVLSAVAQAASPVTRLAGLPGEALVVFLASISLNLPAAVASASALTLNLREATILALACLTAHGFFLETAAMRKTGSSASKMVLLRLVAAVASAWVLDLLLPADYGNLPLRFVDQVRGTSLLGMLGDWAATAYGPAATAALIVAIVTIGRALAAEFEIEKLLARIVAPAMKYLGLAPASSALWVAMNLGDYAKAAPLVRVEIEQGRMKPQYGDLLNHHAAMCHSLLEDSLLLVAFGLPLFWITVPRLLLALLVVWVERIRRHYFRRSFRAGVA